MDLGIKDRVALVAAASRGLGKAIALRFSQEGAKIVICARDEDRLFKARDEIAAATGGNVEGIKADVTDRDQVSDLVKKVT